MTQHEQARARLAALLAAPGDDFDLAEAALLVAAQAYPHLSVPRELARLDDLAEDARPWVDSDADWPDGLSRFLFLERGFRGNTVDYHDPRNSYFNQVLDRRLGLPIMLSLLYVEVARRCGRRAEGVGLPGHFVVRAFAADAVPLLDPFNGGVHLTEDDCRARLAQLYGPDVPLRPEHLAATPRRDVLARILRNLKSALLRRGDVAAALDAVEVLVLVQPEVAEERRDRGLLHMRLGHLRAAIADLEQYLETSPPADEAGPLRAILEELRQRWDRRN